MDQGAWDLRLALLPHRQALAKDELFRKADEFMLPPVLLGDSLHDGFFAVRSAGALDECEQDTGVLLSALKCALDGRGVILRAFAAGEEGGALALEAAKAQGSFHLHGHEIKTLRIEGGQLTECDLLEHRLDR